MTPDEQAAQTYLKRQDRTEHPAGKFDKGGRFYPSSEEWQDCCSSIRNPSRSYPYSLMTHCRSMEHVANLYAVDVAAVRQTVKVLREKVSA